MTLVEIRKFFRGPLAEGEPLSRHTTFEVGGPADLLAEPEDEEDLRAILNYLEKKGEPWMALGRGSNMLVSDGGYRGVAVKVCRPAFNRWDVEGEMLTVGAGLSLPRAVGAARAHSLSGLEFAAGIPGSVGGALVMNAGAFGGDMAGVVEEVRVVGARGGRWISKLEAGFAYRHSSLPLPGTVLTAARMRLKKGEAALITARIHEVAKIRRTSQHPAARGSAGCVFKNPSGHDPAGKIIDDLGFKGFRMGGAEVSAIHANYVLNSGGAKAADILNMMEHLRGAVSAKTGVILENEVILVGFGS